MNRAGKYIENMTGEAMYKSFQPSALPPEPPLEINEHLLKLLVEANRQLAQLDTASQLIPDIDLFVSMYVRKEALMSSQIEGTQCTLEDILDPQLDASANADVSEVINYVKAARFALKRLETF